MGGDDNTHEIVGTSIRLRQVKKGNQELENWLRYLLSKNADFIFQAADIDGKHVELIIISKANGTPVAFEKTDYIRSGSYTKKLADFPALRTRLWDKLRKGNFEEACAVAGISMQSVIKLLDCEAYFDLLQITPPNSMEGFEHYLVEDGLVVRQDDGLYSITNLGAILLAKKLSDFRNVGRKAIRIVQYDGINRLTIRKEEEINEGYAMALAKAVGIVNILLPSKEDINTVRRTSSSAFPMPAIREAIANSLIHQDLYITGSGPLVEVFDNRVEVTNPGVPLVDVMRIVDNPPKSRNEKLASLMRRMGMCEELGRGWDRMVISCEKQLLAAPRIQVYQESTKVTMFSSMQFAYISQEDKLWSTYLHACIKFIEGGALTNSSLRGRFGLKDTSSGSISRLIKEAVAHKIIKPLDPNTAKRYMRYIPMWA